MKRIENSKCLFVSIVSKWKAFPNWKEENEKQSKAYCGLRNLTSKRRFSWFKRIQVSENEKNCIATMLTKLRNVISECQHHCCNLWGLINTFQKNGDSQIMPLFSQRLASGWYKLAILTFITIQHFEIDHEIVHVSSEKARIHSLLCVFIKRKISQADFSSFIFMRMVEPRSSPVIIFFEVSRASGSWFCGSMPTPFGGF